MVELMTFGARMSNTFTVLVLTLGVLPLSTGRTRAKFRSGEPEDVMGYCEFPEYLWASSNDQAERVWITRSHYPGNSGNWTVRREMTVKRTQIAIKVVTRGGCRQDDKNTSYSVPCFRKILVQRIICLAEEPEQKFRVQIKTNKREEFACLKFLKRNKQVVQMWSASPKSVNEDVLCYDSSLERDPWPWIATHREEWSFCPLKGGFDFRAYVEGRKRKVCKHQWRPSRMESECIRGEGTQFHFPDERCSIFNYNPQELLLYCWGSWEEEDYTFVILGEEDELPQYSLRLPRSETNSFKQFTAYLYFNPVAPLRLNGRPPGDILWAELRMLRSDPGVCYDESEKCPEFAREGKCTNSALHEYANYCKKSCGLCGRGYGHDILEFANPDFVPSTRAECIFPKDYRSDWLFYETERMDEVTIDDGLIKFSELGSFICKSKHWGQNKYKLYSFYENGCRPRYSCMHFRRNSEMLLFRLARSELSDRSFDLCQFRDDPLPLGGQIRSEELKILLPKERAQFGSCGLEGMVHVNATFPGHRSCDGTMSDWDDSRCQTRAQLSLSLYPCEGYNWKDYFCVVYIPIAEGFSVLLTKETEASRSSSEYQCWMVRTAGERMLTRPWREAFLLPSGQCGTTEDFMKFAPSKSRLAVHVHKDIIERNKKCNPSKYKAPQSTTPVQYHLSHGDNSDVVINNEQPVAGQATRPGYNVVSPKPTDIPGRGLRDSPKGSFSQSQNGAFLSRSTFVRYVVAFVCLLQLFGLIAL